MPTKTSLSVLLLVAASITAQAAQVWNVGRNDNAWNLTGTGGGPSAVFVQEQGVISPLPGSPSNVPTVPASQSADNDYYFAGVYSMTIPSATAFYGNYSPVGVVSANEEAAERAYAGGDLDLRYHFNLPSSLGPSDLFTISYDALNLDVNPADGTVPAPTDPRFGVEVYFNGVLVGPQTVIRPAQIGTTITTAPFSLSSVNAQTGPGADNIVSLKGISYLADGGGNWMGIDYVQLDVTPVPEPSSIALMMLVGGLGLMAFRLRRRG
jgi:hypothetical protein